MSSLWSAVRTRAQFLLIATPLLVGPLPAFAQEGGVLRVAMPQVQGPRKALRSPMPRRIRSELRRLGVEVVSGVEFARARATIKRRRGRRLSLPALDRAAARAVGAPYLLRVVVSRRSEVRESRGGIFTRTRYGTVARLVDSAPKTKKSAMKVRVVYYTPEEGRERAALIASEVVAKMRALQSGGGSRAIARAEEAEEEESERGRGREARRRGRHDRRRAHGGSHHGRRRSEPRDAFEREDREGGEGEGEALALEGRSRRHGRRHGFRRARSTGFEREGEVEGGVATTLEFGEERGNDVEFEAQLSTYVGGVTASSVVLSPRIPLSEKLSLYAEASLYRAWSDENAGSIEEGLDDIELGVEYEDLFRLGSFSGAVSTGVQFPTSPEARDVDNVFTWLAGAELEGPEGIFTPKFGLGFRKYFATIPVEELPPPEGEGERERVFCATSIQTICPFLGEFPPNFLISAELGFELTDPWLEAFRAEVSLGYELVDAGEIEQTTEGVISLTYAPSNLWNVSLGTLTFSPLTNEEGGLRFPFFDLESDDGLNYTLFFARVSYTPGAEEESEGRE